MESHEITIHIKWGIYVKGVNQADLTEKEQLCRRVARTILGITDEPVEVWQDTYIKPAADRPGRDAMLRAAQQGDFSILVTPGPHHISRDIHEYVRITRTLAESKVTVHFADGTTQDCHETERHHSGLPRDRHRPLYTIYRRVSSAAQGVDTKTDRTAAFRRVQERLERARRKQNTPSGSARRGTGRTRYAPPQRPPPVWGVRRADGHYLRQGTPVLSLQELHPRHGHRRSLCDSTYHRTGGPGSGGVDPGTGNGQRPRRGPGDSPGRGQANDGGGTEDRRILPPDGPGPGHPRPEGEEGTAPGPRHHSHGEDGRRRHQNHGTV